MEAWQIYMDEFRTRGMSAAARAFERNEALAEAAHDAYRVTSDRLTQQLGWRDERALVTLRGFNAAVQNWMRADELDWGVLERQLAELEVPAE